MPSTFEGRMRVLLDYVGSGKLQTKAVVDQVYAKYQHERLDLKHPSGGEAKYLTKTLYEGHTKWYQHMADHAFEPDGLRRGAIDAAKDIIKGVEHRAPRDIQNLRYSCDGKVLDGGRIVFYEPPKVKRLSKTQLRALSRLRRH